MLTNKNTLLPLLFSATMISACAGTSMDNKPSNVATKTAASSAATLTAANWQLVSRQTSGKTSSTFNSGDAVNRYTLTVKANRLSVTGGCNNMSGLLTLGADNSFHVGPMMSTKRACVGTLMQSDAELSSLLSRVNQYTINNQRLSLRTDNGDALIFKGEPTAQSKYSGEGVRKFIEINSTDKGIQWREAKYDANWIRIKDNAAWQSNFPGIEGFTPKVGMHYIVRLFEYTDPKTKQPVWVKDMVTTTGIL
ncbi:META domain-containing protein [Leucothrix sargassi]|nr:META domain-containing protein [Leucothrix sargassi]